MVVNVHERRLTAAPDAVGHLLDALASDADGLWPRDRWPAMRFDRPLAVGADGGHGPVRYRVEDLVPDRLVRFRFTAPTGFDGYHEYVVVPLGERDVLLRHSLVMRTLGRARLSWPLIWRPLHDALIEDSLDRAALTLGRPPATPVRWSGRVRLLRVVARIVRHRRAPAAGELTGSR